jgi:putative membrane protein
MSFSDLPAINATLNGMSAVLLIGGFIFIRRKQQAAHAKCMIGAVICSILFLICYLTYHSRAGATYFRDPAWFRPYYLGLLISHMILAVAIVPLVIITLTRALKSRFELHKKIARWTWPIWMYVSVTGVLVYLLLYKIYPQPGTGIKSAISQQPR